MEHVGTKEIVPYPQYVPPLEGYLLEVLLYHDYTSYILFGLTWLILDSSKQLLDMQ